MGFNSGFKGLKATKAVVVRNDEKTIALNNTGKIFLLFIP